MAEYHQIGGVFACFCNSRSKKTPSIQMFLAGRKPKKPRYLRCFFFFLPLVAKKTLFTMFFGQHLAKTLVFTEVSPCNKMWFLDPKRTKNCKLQCFESALRVRGRREGGEEGP